MKIKAILFDMDGTLLPMDQMRFVKAYLGLLAKKRAPHGYDPKKLVDGIWSGTAAMVKNDGSQPNEAVFWHTFSQLFGEACKDDLPIFEEFYHTDFNEARNVCGFASEASDVIALVKEKGLRAVLATNPIFPAVATENRIRWAGLSPTDFELYTTYENSCHCKPSPAYYRDILAEIGLQAEECLMVGNDAREDMVAAELGMQVFLLTDCLINTEDRDLSAFSQGGFPQLLDFIRAL